jgi:hypothetical protein
MHARSSQTIGRFSLSSAVVSFDMAPLMRDPELWKSNLLEAVAYGVSFLFVVAAGFYLRFGFEAPRHDAVPPGHYSWTPEKDLVSLDH